VTDLKGILKTLKQIKHRRPQPKFCPSCKGHNIYPTAIIGILPTIYRCRDCGYKGALVLEIDVESRDSSETN